MLFGLLVNLVTKCHGLKRFLFITCKITIIGGIYIPSFNKYLLENPILSYNGFKNVECSDITVEQADVCYVI